jgi:PKD repeat protein
LKVKDNSGFEDAIGLKTAKIHINYPPVVKWHTVPEVAEPNEPVVFDSKGTYDPDGTILSVTWSFPDGTVLTGPKVTKSFKNSGVVAVKITADDGQGFGNSVQTKEFPVLVNNMPIIVTKNLIHTNSQIVNLDASQSYDIDGQALKFDWLLSDGTHRHESSFNWQVPSGGVHFITLTVDDGQGKKNSIARETIRLIVNRPPVAVVDSIIFSCSGQTILLNGSRCYDPDNDPLTAQWNFADGTTSAEMNPAHVYTKPGYYNVQLVLSDGFSEKPTVATIPVIVEGSPQAVQGFADTTVCVNAPVEFDAALSSDPNGPLGSYTWDFGDAITAFGSKVSHTFSKPGTYYVLLTVVGNGSGRCSRVSQASSTVHVVEGPSAEFLLPEAVSINEVIHVDASKSKPNGTLLSTKWTIQSSDTVFAVDGSQAQFALPRPGVYDVKLALTIESKTNCNNAILVRSVRVNAPPVLKWNVPKAIALGDLLVMDAAGSYDPDGIIKDYVWTLDGKVIATTQAASIIMTAAGKHTVGLQITDNSGTSSSSVSQETVVDVNSKPSPSFSLPDLMYEGESANLLPLPSADADGDVLSFLWKIDGREYTQSTLSFEKSGKHIVKLIANDGRGLNNSVDSVSKEISVIAKPDLKTLSVPKNWLVGSEVNIAEITSFRGVGFIADSALTAQMQIRTEGKQAIMLGWAPKGIVLAKEQFDIQVWPTLEFTSKPEPQELIWNPSNPAAVIKTPDVNRPENRNVRFEWKKGTMIIGYGKVVAVPLTKGENRFVVTALDQDMVGARPVSVEIVVICQ